MDNLDTLAAQCAQDLVVKALCDGNRKAADLDNMATKALGVLQENGVYAGMLFLYSKGEDAYARALREGLLGALGVALEPLKIAYPGSPERSEWRNVSEHLIAKACNDLHTLLLVKQVWEQMLIYVRYGAKARG